MAKDGMYDALMNTRMWGGCSCREAKTSAETTARAATPIDASSGQPNDSGAIGRTPPATAANIASAVKAA